MSEAHMSEAHMSEAHMSEAHMSEAHMSEARFRGVLLRVARCGCRCSRRSKSCRNGRLQCADWHHTAHARCS
jgi:uncharacterized protein YjbI with pentapeptide repeats